MTFTLQRGSTPLLISMPHVGTLIPDELRSDLNERALAVEDTDWFVDRLYSFASALGAGLLVPRLSRYAIDLNRPSDNQPMYPGRNNTELCPTRAFSGAPLYRDGRQPDEAEVRRRVGLYWQPYHQALRDELARLRAAHGHAVLFDAHSIKGELPWLFDGALPDLNLGTASGTSCDATLRARLTALFEAQSRYTFVVDGRFKGGHITRSHGQPAAGVHAVQLEMSWRAYMDESRPPAWDEARVAALTPLLRQLVQAMIDWRPA